MVFSCTNKYTRGEGRSRGCGLQTAGYGFTVTAAIAMAVLWLPAALGPVSL